jgi:hypothetical protein
MPTVPHQPDFSDIPDQAAIDKTTAEYPGDGEGGLDITRWRYKREGPHQPKDELTINFWDVKRESPAGDRANTIVDVAAL